MMFLLSVHSVVVSFCFPENLGCSPLFDVLPSHPIPSFTSSFTFSLSFFLYHLPVPSQAIPLPPLSLPIILPLLCFLQPLFSRFPSSSLSCCLSFLLSLFFYDERLAQSFLSCILFCRVSGLLFRFVLHVLSDIYIRHGRGF